MKYQEYAKMAKEAIEIGELDFAREIIKKAKENYNQCRKETEERMQYYEDSDRGSMGIAMGFFCQSNGFETVKRAEECLENRLFDVETRNLESALINLPEVQRERDIIQNEFHDYDVYNHTLKVVEALRSEELGKKLNCGKVKDKDLLAAAYLHDIGKPVVAQPRMYNGILQYDEEGRQRHTFPNHEKVGEEMVRSMTPGFFKKRNLNQDKIAKLVGAHYMPMTWLKKIRKTEDFKKFSEVYNSFTDELESTGLAEEILELFYADTIGKGNSMDDETELLNFLSASIRTIHNQRYLVEPWLESVYKIQYSGGEKRDRRYAIKK